MLRLRELAVEPPLMRGKRIVEGKPKPKIECFFDMVALGASGLAERCPISKLEVENRNVCEVSALMDFLTVPVPSSFVFFFSFTVPSFCFFPFTVFSFFFFSFFSFRFSTSLSAFCISSASS
jgi:hypothetical protein